MSKNRSWFCFIKTFFSQQQLKKGNGKRWLFGKRKKSLKPLALLETEALRHEPPVTNEVSRSSDSVARELIIDIESYEAALKIQTSYRGHLARKALRAIKGFVILQGIIRGQAVRRQAATTLRCLQSIVSIQSEICARRRYMTQETSKSDYLSLEFGTQKAKIHLSKERRSSDCRFPTEDDEISIISTKKDAIRRRQRIKTCSFNPRISTDSEDEDAISRRKYCQSSCTDVVPTYMASTKSAKAKTRLKPIHFDSYSDGDSPYKYTFSQMSSINSKVSNQPQQNSPSLKGVSGPIRSNRLKD